MRQQIEWIRWYVKSDVELRCTTCWYDENGLVEKIDGFRFYSKRPFSTSYQVCGNISLESTYDIISLIREAIEKRRKAVALELRVGAGTERLFIRKGSFRKCEEQLFEMIKQIQAQY